MKSRLLGMVYASIISLISLSTDAALITKLGGLVVYDDDRDITWIQNANLAASDTFGLPTSQSLGPHPSANSDVPGIINSGGSMNYPGALHWIDAVNVFDGGNGYLGFNNWRLPAIAAPDSACTSQNGGSYPTGVENGIGYNCTGSEMPHLFYDEFGAEEQTSVLDTGDPDTLALFSNLQSDSYWVDTSDTELPIFSEVTIDVGVSFRFQNGSQGLSAQTNCCEFAWAVHDGDIGAVPIPPAVWLFGSGLLGLIGIARRETQPKP